MRRYRLTPRRLAWAAPTARTAALTVTFIVLGAALAHAQQSPWETAVSRLQQAFTGPIAKGLALVAIVVGGLAMAYGEGNKKAIAGLVFGLGMAVGAVNFLSWLFG
jgi:type IV secretory pathway VirB2 component (pilin)